MATRQETAQRRSRLARELRAGCDAWAPDELIPSVNVLARRHQLSAPVVHEEIRKLVEAGALYAIAGVGTFVSPPSAPAEPFLFVTHDASSVGYEAQVRRGFEERIAELGGAVVALLHAEAQELWKSGDLPRLAGIFQMDGVTGDGLFATAPFACFGYLSDEAPWGDAVQFDDVNGGFQATQHLLKLGHERIAFVGLHNDDENEFRWSHERERGWRAAMNEAARPTAELNFHPAAPCGIWGHQQILLAQKVAQSLAERADVTAVVATNNFAARGVLRALEAANVPASRWPALVCFDGLEELDSHVISALRLPWSEIGHQAAELLWQRATGKHNGSGQQRLVPMKLIPRLTCRPQWAQTTRVLQRNATLDSPVAVAA